MSDKARQELLTRYFHAKGGDVDTIHEHEDGDFLHTGGVTFTPVNEEDEREDGDGDMVDTDVTEMGQSASFNIAETQFRPSGTSGTDGEHDSLLECAIGEEKHVSTKEVTAVDGSEITLNNVTDIRDFDILFFKVDGKWEGTQVQSRFTIGSKVVISPPLSDDPSIGSTVLAGKQFRPTDSETDLPLFTGYICAKDSIQALIGAIVNEWTLNFPSAEPVTISASGEGSGAHSYLGKTKLHSSADPGDAEFEMEKGSALLAYVEHGGLYARIGDEIVKVTEVDTEEDDYDVFKVDRGQKATDAESHSAEDELVPYRVSPTRIGKPVSHLGGRVVIEGYGVRMVLNLRSASVSQNHNYVWESSYGDAIRKNYYRQGPRPRETTVTLEPRFTRDAEKLRGIAGRRMKATFVIWAGRESGRMIALAAPSVHFQFPALSSGTGETHTLQFEGRLYDKERGNNDELRVSLP